MATSEVCRKAHLDKVSSNGDAKHKLDFVVAASSNTPRQGRHNLGSTLAIGSSQCGTCCAHIRCNYSSYDS